MNAWESAWEIPTAPNAYERTLEALEEQAERRHRERQRVSPAEVCLLTFLLDRGLEPEQQVPIGPYDLDFYFADVKLCVEVDGRQHLLTQEKDSYRDRYLRKRGIGTFRIPAQLVYWCPSECVTLIGIILGSLRRGHQFPDGMMGPVLGLLQELREERIREWEFLRPWRP